MQYVLFLRRMEIFFDWELDKNLQQPIHKWVYEELRTFLKVRYKPMEDEIDAAQKENEIAFVVFIWHESGDVELRPFNIPAHLEKKLMSSISHDDMDYIMNRIGQNIDKKSNEN